ncbi:MAG: ferredoxin, partial [Candidatus Methylomirabilis sp.]|nr:ferredoxin [Deltaproteobacteria bacterium]
MKVRVDRELCEANAKCVSVAPEVFELNDDDSLVILQEEPGEALREKVRWAVERCPRG